MKLFYSMGRFLQVAALVLMPFSIWAGQLGHNERGAIAIFVGSIGVFFIGLFFARFR